MLSASSDNLATLAAQINAAHASFTTGLRDTIAYAMEAGELLIRARQALPHGEWLPWLRAHFRGSQSTAFRYMLAASNRPQIEANYSRAESLSLRSVVKMLTKERHADGFAPASLHGESPREAKVTPNLQSLIEAGCRFGTIYADPPWQYGNQATRAATDNHYPTMSLAEIATLPVKSLAADDAHLHLWVTSSFLFDAKEIIDAWGFDYRSSFVWAKPQMGIGNYWRMSHEYLLLGIRGDAKRFNERSMMSWASFDRTKHSAKPHEIRQMVEKASPGPRLELFGRQKVSGWTVWGNQVDTSPGMFDAAREAA